MCRPKTGPRRSLLTRKRGFRGELHDRSDLDGAEARPRDLGGHLHGPIYIACLNEVIAAELLLGFGKWSVGVRRFPLRTRTVFAAPESCSALPPLSENSKPGTFVPGSLTYGLQLIGFVVKSGLVHRGPRPVLASGTLIIATGPDACSPLNGFGCVGSKPQFFAA